jgi:hypothetical protein
MFAGGKARSCIKNMEFGKDQAMHEDLGIDSSFIILGENSALSVISVSSLTSQRVRINILIDKAFIEKHYFCRKFNPCFK